MKQRPIADGEEVAHVVGELLALGFKIVKRSKKSKSRYLRYGRCPCHVRVSDHPWWFHDRHPDVIVSQQVKAPITQTECALLALEIGVRFVCAVREHKGLIRERAA